MINKWLLVFLCLVFVQLGIAQQNDLQIEGVTPNLYVTHIVQPKENWYSVGRIYNVSPKQLAPYNNLTMGKALAIGQTLKIPLTAENFSQDGSKASDEMLVPVRHTIQPKEWLFRVSVNYNKVPVENLEKWNGINKDQAKAGLPLIVGYLKVKNGQSALASKGETKIASTNPVPLIIPEKKPDEKKPDVKKPVTAPATDAVDPTLVRSNTNNQPKKEESKPVITTAPPVTTTVTAVVNKTPAVDSKINYFRTQYEESGKSVSGNAGIFKSTSGWNDGKYYALVNNVAVGTIVKVNNPVSGKTIFAKVLGNLPDMKESIGLIARLSDAAAAQIEANGIKFSVEVRY
ncbi:MAG TPA: LysM peptidoglycan-binding domain-containing protein [Chitinophagaceae bacterium]|jgi:LysM repeat protein|nr:LysM peptidoglycan-binding domain-containing protein [Chitinophagaceae bacterium]